MQAPTDENTTNVIKDRLMSILESGERKGSFPVKADLSNYQPSKYFPNVKVTAKQVSDKHYVVEVEF